MFVGGMLLFAACKQGQPGEKSGGPLAKDTVLHYFRPEIPPMMTDPEQRAVFYVKHYWDGYSLVDTAFIHSDETEQLYADFIDALKFVGPEDSHFALQKMMTLMEMDSIAYAHFCSLGEKYLYDPNSPMRNEEYYIPVLEQMLASPRLTEAERLRPADRLEQARKNRPGMPAPDFVYVTPGGQVHRMSRLQAEFTVLFFYDPDCSNCQQFERMLAEMPFFVDLQEKGRVRVLAVYPDEDEAEWLFKSSHMPKGWIVGWNKAGDIRSKQLYEIRATPTLYLLDKQKKVVLKDAAVERILHYLSEAFPTEG